MVRVMEYRNPYSSTPILQSQQLRGSSHEALHFLPQLRVLPCAHRAESERIGYEQAPIHLRRGGGEQLTAAYQRSIRRRSFPRWRTTAGFSHNLSPSSSISKRNTQAGAASPRPGGQSPRPQHGDGHRLRSSSDPEFARAQSRQERIRSNRRAGEPLGAALDRSRPVGLGANDRRPTQARQILLRRYADAGRYLPGAAARQRPPLRLRPGEVSGDFRNRKKCMALAAFANAAPEKQPDAE